MGDSVNLNKAIIWVIHASDQSAVMCIEPAVKFARLGIIGDGDIEKVIAHPFIEQDNIRGDAFQTFIEGQRARLILAIRPAKWHDEGTKIEIFQAEPVIVQCQYTRACWYGLPHLANELIIRGRRLRCIFQRDDAGDSLYPNAEEERGKGNARETPGWCVTQLVPQRHTAPSYGDRRER